MAQQFKAFLLSLFVVFGLVACGGEDSPESLMDKGVESMSKATEIMKKITDEESAKEHKKDLGEAFVAFKAFVEKGEIMEKTLSAEKRAELKKLGMEKMKPAMAGFQAQMKRIMSNPKIAEVLKPVLEKFMK